MVPEQHLQADREERPDERPPDDGGEGRVEDLLVVHPADPVRRLAQRGVGEGQDHRLDQRPGDDGENIEERGREERPGDEGGRRAPLEHQAAFAASAPSKRSQTGRRSTTCRVLPRLVHGEREDARLQRVERRDRHRPAPHHVRDHLRRHGLVGAVVLRELGRGVFLVDHPGLGQHVGHVEDPPDEVALRLTPRAEDGEAAELVGRVQVGVEVHPHPVGIFHDRDLIVDDIRIGVEHPVGAVPARRLAVEELEVVDPLAPRVVLGDEGLAPAEARHPLRPRADDRVVEVEVVAALLQHEAARPFLVAPPVAHEEGAVVGEDVLRRLDRHDLAQPPLRLRRAQVAVHRRIAQHEADQQPLLPVHRQQPRQRVALLDRRDDGLLGEDLAAPPPARAGYARGACGWASRPSGGRSSRPRSAPRAWRTAGRAGCRAP